MISRDKYYRSRFDRVPPAPPNHDRGRDIISVHEDTDGDGMFDKHKVVLDGLNMANAVAPRPRRHLGDAHAVPALLPRRRRRRRARPRSRSAPRGLRPRRHALRRQRPRLGPGRLALRRAGQHDDQPRHPARASTRRTSRASTSKAAWSGAITRDTKAYEIFAEGGGNNFGLEFDAEGRLYSGHNGGDTRGWHFVQGGLYLKQGIDPGKFGPPRNPFAFGELTMMKSRNPIPRFTHATIVAEGTALPAQLRRARSSRRPAAPQRRRRRTLSRAARPSRQRRRASRSPAPTPRSARSISTNAPDGAIYVADFYEEFIAHGQNYQGQIDPSTGRVYRLRGKDAPLNKDVNLAAKTTRATDRRCSRTRTAGTARRPSGCSASGAIRDDHRAAACATCCANRRRIPRSKRCGRCTRSARSTSATALAALAHPAAPVRAWAVRLLGDASSSRERFVAARDRDSLTTEPDAEVRAQIASTARRLPADAGAAAGRRAAAPRRGCRRPVHPAAVLVDDRVALRRRPRRGARARSHGTPRWRSSTSSRG